MVGSMTVGRVWARRLMLGIVATALAAAGLTAGGGPAAAAGALLSPGTIFIGGQASRFTFASGVPPIVSAPATVFAVDGLGNTYAANTVSDSPGSYTPGGTYHEEVTKYPADGSAAVVLARTPSQSGGAIQNGGIAVDALGNVYFSDNVNNTVWKVAAGTGALTAVATGFRGLAGIGVDRSGTVYISEYGQSKVWRSTGYGTGPATVFLTGTGFAQGITVDAAGNIYLTEMQNKTIVRVTPNGAQTVVASGLSSPDGGIDIDLAGNLVFIDDVYGQCCTGSTTRLLSVPSTGGPVTVLGTASSVFVYDVAVYKPSAAAFTAATPPGGTYGTPYSYTYATGGQAGTTTFALTSGALPPGLTLNAATGQLSGTPSQAGSFTFAVQATTAGVTATAPQAVLQVAAAPLQATVTGTRVYGGSNSFTVTTVTGFRGADTSAVVTGTPTCSTTTPTSAGVGAFTGTLRTCTGLSAPNYTISYLDGGFTITPAPATVTVTGAQTFGGVPTFSVSRVIDANGATVPYTGSLTGCTTAVVATAGAQTRQGTISGCGGLSAGPNYALSYADGGYTVNPRVLTATVSSNTVYGQPLALAVTGWSGFVLGDNAASTVTGALTGCTSSAPTGAGTYAATITGCTGLAARNYTIAYADGGVTITPAPLTITAPTQDNVYGTDPVVIPVYSAFVGSDTAASLTQPGTCSSTEAPTDGVGTYLTSCTGASSPNYTITYVDGVQTVTPAPLTVPVTGTQTYGGTTTFTAGAPNGLVRGDDAAVLTGTLSGCTSAVTSSTPVGAQADSIVGCAGLSAQNYTVSYADGGVTVTPATLTVTASGTQTYGGTPTFAVTGVSGLMNADTRSVLTGTLSCVSTLPATSPVGSPAGTVSGCNGLLAPNYTVSYANGGVTVTPAPLRVTVTGAATYGGTPTYTASAVSGLVDGESPAVVSGTLTCSTSASTTTVGGPVPGTLTACSGLSSPNYAISYVDGGFTVNPAALTVTVNGTRTYGGNTVTYIPTYAGFVSGDRSTVVTGAPTGCAVAVPATAGVGTTSGAVTGCTGLAATNYTLAYQPGAFTVTPAALTVSPPSTTSTFGTAPTVPAPTVSGWVNGEGIGALTSPPSCTTTATATSPAGTYPITCSGAVAADYTVSYGPPGTLTVNPAAVTATYSGPTTVSTTSSVVPAATLTGPAACIGGQTVTFGLDANPKTGAAGAFPIGTAVTNGAGVATAPAVATTGWTAGARTVTVTTTGNGSCLAATGSTPLAVTTPGAALLGAGSYVSPAGTTTFAVGAVRVGGPSGGYAGGISVVVPGKWWFSGTVSTYVKTSASQGVVAGSGTLSTWSAAANKGRGGWVVAQSGTKITMTVTAAAASSPAAVGVQLGYAAPAGAPALPNSAVTPLRSGVIVLL